MVKTVGYIAGKQQKREREKEKLSIKLKPWKQQCIGSSKVLRKVGYETMFGLHKMLHQNKPSF